MQTTRTRCGTIVLAGRPNVGKSTLLNALLGERLAITSPKPQSTRTPVIGARTDGETQLIFVDPAGLLEPSYALQEAMVAKTVAWLERADAILYLQPANERTGPPLTALLPPACHVAAPVATVLTKVDLAPAAEVPPGTSFAVSATTGQGLEALLQWCRARAPEGAFRQATDDLSAQPIRFFVGEFVREAAFELLDDELPYAVAAEVEEFREGTPPVYIRVTLYVERESQKGMVIGRDGQTIKRLGAHARARIEHLIGERVFLDLWVKVLPKWRTNPHALHQLGFPAPTSRT